MCEESGPEAVENALSTLGSTRLGASANIPVFGWNTREVPPRSECQMNEPFSLSSIVTLSQPGTAVVGPGKATDQLWGL